MRKCIAFLLLVLLVFSVMPVFAETPDTILFRNIPWMETYSVVKPQLDSIDGIEIPWYSPIDKEARIDSWYKQSKYIYTDANVTNGGVTLSYNKASVAGYTADLKVSFIRPIVNGKIVYDTDAAQFYKAVYTIEDLEDMKGASDGLISKLTQLYGTPEDNTYTDIFGNKDPIGKVWKAKDGSLVWLGLYYNSYSEKYDEIAIIYAAPNTDEMLIALDKQMSKEAADAEAEDREKNNSNFDGL